MNVALRTPMTVQEFLAWEERQEFRYEFDGFRPMAVPGGTVAHSAVQRNLLIGLGTRLRGKPCQPYGSDLKLQVAGRIRYPDAFVVCRPVAPGDTVIADPVVVFEILSESSTNADLVDKNQEYRTTPSVQRYVVLEQTHAAAVVFARKGDDWISEIVSGQDSMLRMREIGVDIPLSELYEGAELAKTGADGTRDTMA